MPKLRMICPNCRSYKITVHGWVEWNEEKQAWDIDEIDGVICFSCHGSVEEYISEEIK